MILFDGIILAYMSHLVHALLLKVHGECMHQFNWLISGNTLFVDLSLDQIFGLFAHYMGMHILISHLNYY